MAFGRYLSAMNAQAFAELAVDPRTHGWWLHGGTTCSDDTGSLQTHGLQEFFTVH